ncbi:hypothetical protein GCM10029976_094720 [Kribbella albertanoniae]
MALRPDATRVVLVNTYENGATLMTTAARVSGYLAAAMATGLAIAHLSIYTVGWLNSPETPLSAYLVGGVAISAAALGFALGALMLVRRPSSWRKTSLTLCWTAAVLLSAQALLIAVAEPALLIRIAGPGPWSLIGGPAFAVAAWRSRQVKAPR